MFYNGFDWLNEIISKYFLTLDNEVCVCTAILMSIGIIRGFGANSH